MRIFWAPGGNYSLVADSELKAAFEEHKDAIYRFAWRMTDSAVAAEDVAQDVFLSLLRQPGRFDPSRGRLRSFLLGITRNLVLKRWRDENQWEKLVDEQFAVEPVSIKGNEIAQIVADAFGALPLLQREVLILAEYEELSLEEIARAVAEENISQLRLREVFCRVAPINNSRLQIQSLRRIRILH